MRHWITMAYALVGGLFICFMFATLEAPWQFHAYVCCYVFIWLTDRTCSEIQADILKGKYVDPASPPD